MVDLPRKGERDPNNVPFRGVQPAAFAIRDELTDRRGAATSSAACAR